MVEEAKFGVLDYKQYGSNRGGPSLPRLLFAIAVPTSFFVVGATNWAPNNQPNLACVTLPGVND